MSRWVKFGGGGILGAVVGAAVGMLLAPRGGAEFRRQIEERLQQAQLAGVEAKAAKTEEMIRRFRSEVADPSALRDEELKVRMETARTVAALGLSLNAPGAIAAQESALRQAERSVRPSPAPAT